MCVFGRKRDCKRARFEILHIFNTAKFLVKIVVSEELFRALILKYCRTVENGKIFILVDIFFNDDMFSISLLDLATFEGAESRVNTLVAAANSHDNLCRMDPAWHPWL